MSDKNNNNRTEDIDDFRREIEERERENQTYVEGGELPIGDEGSSGRQTNTADGGDITPPGGDEETFQGNGDDGAGAPPGGSESAPDEGGVSNGNAEENNENLTPPSDGQSHAYAQIPECDIYGKPKKKSDSSSDKKNYPKPSERYKKTKSDDKDKNFMELFWKEFILASYDWVLNTTVDTCLDFVDHILYDRPQSSEEAKDEKLDIYNIGQNLRAATKEKIIKRKEICNKGLREIQNNLERDKQGMPVEWKIMAKEPTYFKALSRINKKDESQRTPGEKRILQEFNDVPSVMNNMIDEGIKLRELAIAAATCECAANKEAGIVISQNFDNSFESLKSALKSGDTTKVNNVSFEMEREIDDDNPFYNYIREQLTSLRENGNKDSKTIIANITKKIEEAKENPAYWESQIKKKEHNYFKEINKEKESINNQSPYPVSKEFSEKLEILNKTLNDPQKDGKTKKTEITALLTSMEGMFDESNDTHKELKQDILTLKNIAITSKDDKFVRCIDESVSKFNEKHKENSPILKEKENYYKELVNAVAELKKSTKDYTSGLKSLFSHNEKRKTMLDNVAKVQTEFTKHKDRERSDRGPVFSAERVCMDTIANLRERG